jgi:hypothetical protein
MKSSDGKPPPMSDAEVMAFLAEEERLDREYRAMLANPAPEPQPRAVWVVSYGTNGPGPLSAIYDNEEAARAHLAMWDRMALRGTVEDVLRIERWVVQSRLAVKEGAE